MTNKDLQFANKKEENRPLQAYGKIANDYMEQHYPFKRVTLLMNEELMSYLYSLEDQAIEEELVMTKEALKKHPYPTEANVLQREKHLQVLVNQVQEVVTNNMIKKINQPV